MWTEHTHEHDHDSPDKPMHPLVMLALIVGFVILSSAVVCGVLLLYIQVASEGG